MYYVFSVLGGYERKIFEKKFIPYNYYTYLPEHIHTYIINYNINNCINTVLYTIKLIITDC